MANDDFQYRTQLDELIELRDENKRLSAQVLDLQEVLADKRRVARQLDVALHGREGAAKQASLCDLIHGATALRAEHTALRSALEAIVAFENTISDPSWREIYKITKTARAALVLFTSPYRGS